MNWTAPATVGALWIVLAIIVGILISLLLIFILISWRKLGEYIAGNYSGFFNDSTRHAEIMKRLNELEEKIKETS